MPEFRSLFLLPLMWIVVTGCGGEPGPERASVSGTVTFNGEPLETGSIVFLPTGATSGPSTGEKIKNGVYTIPAEKGAVIGEHRVQIKSIQKTGKQVEVGPPAPPGKMADELEQVIPAKYNTDSELTAEIHAGENTGVDFALEAE